MDYKWHNLSESPYDDWRYVDNTGKIVGWIISTQFTFRALVKNMLSSGHELGEYVTTDQAKKAIEVYFSKV